MKGNEHFWHIVLYDFKKGKNATEKHTKNICAVYGEGAVTGQLCQKWFEKFGTGGFSLNGALWSVLKLKLIAVKLRQYVEKNHCFTT